MNADPRTAGYRSRAVLAAALVTLAACATGGGAARPADSRGSASVAQPADATALPPLAVSQISEGGAAAQRIRDFTVLNQDVRLVIQALAQNFSLGYQLDPDVRGAVSTRLENATLEQALASVLGPLGYGYQIENGIIRVSGTRVQSRIFSLDYVSLNRVGSTSTVLTTGGVSGAGIGAGTGGVTPPTLGGVTGQPTAGIPQQSIGFGGGSNVIQSTTAADLWTGIRIALESLVFEGIPGDTARAGQTTQTIASPSGVATVSGTTARSSSDGRRLIIDPMAGTIFVAAPPAKLAEVEAYINAIQSSVQRQVLIEAKIVQISLKREFRFGIDWRTLSERSKLRINFVTGIVASNTASLTLGGGASEVVAALAALETQGDVSVIAAPMLSALNNQPASFDATTAQVFFSVTRQPVFGPTGQIVATNTVATPVTIPIGIVLNFLAQIGADGTITMQIRPSLSALDDIAEFDLPEGGKVTSPVVARRETDTMARVRDGETIIIGGLTFNRRDRQRSGVPGLRDLPGIGGVFGSTQTTDQKDEIVIFLTPTIIAGQANTAAR